MSNPNINPGELNGAAVLLRTLLVVRRRLALGLVVAGGMIAAAIALLMPNTYTASAVIMLPQADQSSVSMLLGQLGPLAAAAGADFGLKNPGDLYASLLASRTIADHVIARFGLKGIYGTRTDTDTRGELSRHARFRAGRDSLIRIEVADTDPKRAAGMANMFVAELDAQNKRLAASDASERRQFLEDRLAKEKNELAAAEDAMKATQQKTRIIEMSGQTQVAIVSTAQLRAQITAGEIALARLKVGATPENPTVLQAETELAAMRQQLKYSGDEGPLVAASAIPEAGLDYVRRLRDLKYHEFLFEMLSKQYEAARLDESKAAPGLQVVDFAVPPDKKSGPPRFLIALLGCFLGTIAAMGLVYVQSSWPGRGSPEPDRGARPPASVEPSGSQP